MIIRETPVDMDNYILIKSSEMVLKLQEQELYPMYIDNNGVYFIKSQELSLALDKINTGGV